MYRDTTPWRKVLKEYLIGTGGWAYFSVPGVHPLVAYSRAFSFVEVNSTYYQIPPLQEAERWRELVPADFQFAVRAHRAMTLTTKTSSESDAFTASERIRQICTALRAEILHVCVPASFRLSQNWIDKFRDFISSTDLRKLRLALEIRGVRPSQCPPGLFRFMRDYNMIHCTDISKGEMPAYDSDILYSRLFGKGRHNIYQPTDKELAEMDSRASSPKSGKIVMSFHFVRMYKDAARMKIYKQTGRFPRVTGSTGLSSLEEVLDEDARFPTTKQALISSQGWKLFDLSEQARIHAGELLQRLPEKTYLSLSEVIRDLESTVE
jgi:uncharacterized protein YecE (DUF72 family)